MPSILTHYYFIKDTNKENIPFLENEENACLLGVQGVDPFYYYGNILNRFNKEDVNNFAKHIHLKECASLYIQFIKEANKLNKEHKDLVYSYIYGLLNHYTLDKNTHPYIIYKTGVKGDFITNHQKFETELDVLFKAKRNDLIHPKNAIKVDEVTLEIISKIYYSYSLENNFNLEEDTFIKAYKDMYNSQRILYSSNGFKKAFFNTFFKNTKANTLSYPKRVNPDIDYLNEKKNLWQYPHRNFKLSFSFNELLDLANKDFNKLSKILLNAYNNLEFEKDLIKFINNINHNGTLPEDELLYSEVN